MNSEFTGKTILVTGGTGTIGSELVHQLLAFNPHQVRVLSRDDTKQQALAESLGYPRALRLFIGDVRDRSRLSFAFDGVDFVFHAAALKHVPIGEYNPFELVKTNVLGSQNVIEAALERGVSKVIAVSTDKAVNPSSAMGVTKLLMEKLFTNANYYKGSAGTVFSCVRFGNVAWSRGSVLALWREQAARTRVIRVTEPEMTRFFMSQSQAIRLVLRASALAQGGEIFVLKMPAIRLADLARFFVAKYHAGEEVRVEVIGNRGGEKPHEELLSSNERYREILEDDEMFILVPDFEQYEPYHLGQHLGSYPGFGQARVNGPYSSKNCIGQELISQMV